MNISIVHGIIGIVSLLIVLGTFKIKSRLYYYMALVATGLVAVSGLAIKLSGKSAWWRIGLETLATAVTYGYLLYKNRANLR